MMIWYEKLWLRYVRERKKKGFHKAAFKANFTDGVAAAMLIGHTGVVKAPAGCTSKLQPLDICINKLFESIVRERW